MYLTTSNWWWTAGAAVAGLALGAAASRLTRRFLRGERALAGSWWLGAVLTAAVLGLLGWRVGARGELAVYGFVAVLAVPLAVIDWCDHRLPRLLTWPQLAGALVGFGVLCLVRHDPAPGVRALAALAAAGVLFLVLPVATGGGVGAGDVGAAAVVGLVTGWSGWAQVAGALLVASVLALVVLAVPGARRHQENGATAVPFGPCLLAGALVMVVVGG
ncbi:prepilin peptidase [Amycolatopsis rubida]|uniref:Leader peptidase (Prepilin peptidase) / N-methyltransferase n=1 Tax=Amycolatopsis rubida TaxID=112413 RepID=A0A1I5E1V6_9PSEU|nr:prepilin peptidase [Amycolatopsis rubida]SFO05489.1 leader peptidase (prepilin peptidase) / N-methyltransferase [Amycolatopsis rubida]